MEDAVPDLLGALVAAAAAPLSPSDCCVTLRFCKEDAVPDLLGAPVAAVAAQLSPNDWGERPWLAEVDALPLPWLSTTAPHMFFEEGLTSPKGAPTAFCEAFRSCAVAAWGTLLVFEAMPYDFCEGLSRKFFVLADLPKTVTSPPDFCEANPPADGFATCSAVLTEVRSSLATGGDATSESPLTLGSGVLSGMCTGRGSGSGMALF
jgi:hypothetical protein